MGVFVDGLISPCIPPAYVHTDHNANTGVHHKCCPVHLWLHPYHHAVAGYNYRMAGYKAGVVVALVSMTAVAVDSNSVDVPVVWVVYGD